MIALTPPARGALPPAYGGEITLPAPHRIRLPDPLAIDSPFEASLVGATYDCLYRRNSAGAVVPALARTLPRFENGRATISLRDGVKRHDGRILRAIDVVASLREAARSPRAGYLLASVSREQGTPAIEAIDDSTIEIQLERPIHLGRILTAPHLAIRAGARHQGTGAMHARWRGNELVLEAFRFAADGASYLNRVTVQPPREPEAEIRAFELLEIDASWHGTHLFGSAQRVTRTTNMQSGVPVLLVPNRNRAALRGESDWGAVARAIDRRRLERIGLYPDQLLAPGLPPPRLPLGRASGGSLRLPVPIGDVFQLRLAEALAGLLDERGYSLVVDRLTPDAYEAAIRSGHWDLRIANVVPALPGYLAVVAATLAEIGQTAEAAALMRRDGEADDRTHAAQAAHDLPVLVLGHRRDQLYVDVAIHGAEFDGLGHLPLARLFRSRASIPP